MLPAVLFSKDLGLKFQQKFFQYSQYSIILLTTMAAKMRSLFAEYPYCFQKVTIPINRERLILEIKFAANNYEFEPKKYGLW